MPTGGTGMHICDNPLSWRDFSFAFGVLFQSPQPIRMKGQRKATARAEVQIRYCDNVIHVLFRSVTARHRTADWGVSMTTRAQPNGELELHLTLLCVVGASMVSGRVHVLCVCRYARGNAWTRLHRSSIREWKFSRPHAHTHTQPNGEVELYFAMCCVHDM